MFDKLAEFGWKNFASYHDGYSIINSGRMVSLDNFDAGLSANYLMNHEGRSVGVALEALDSMRATRFSGTSPTPQQSSCGVELTDKNVSKYLQKHPDLLRDYLLRNAEQIAGSFDDVDTLENVITSLRTQQRKLRETNEDSETRTLARGFRGLEFD